MQRAKALPGNIYAQIMPRRVHITHLSLRDDRMAHRLRHASRPANTFSETRMSVKGKRTIPTKEWIRDVARQRPRTPTRTALSAVP